MEKYLIKISGFCHKRLLIIFLIPMLINCSDPKPIVPINNPPQISEFSATPNTVPPSDSVKLQVVATDPDKDELFCSYDLTGGSITNPNNFTTYWIAPKDTGTYKIIVTVSDGKLSDKDSVHIKVIPALIITSPRKGEMVDRRIPVEGTCSIIPAEYYIWLVVRPSIENNWYPQGTSTSTNWSIAAIIGLPDSHDEKFYLKAMLIKKNGSLDEDLNNALKNESYIPANDGHSDIILKTEIYVYRI